MGPSLLRTSACSIFVAVLCSLAPSLAHARPMVTPFDEVISSSTDVVVASFNGPIGGGSALQAAGYELRVERALRGGLSGTIVVTPGDGQASFPVGTRLVAFLRNGSFRFVGTATEGHRLEDGAVHVAGFYDFNAHIVTPGMTTIDALVDRLAGRASTVRYVGPLLALSDDGQRRVTTPWTVSVTLRDGQAPVVNGLPVRGLPAPTVGQGGIFGEFSIDYRSSWPRPLQIEGRAVGRQNGAVQMEFWVVEPNLLRVSDLRRYLNDEDIDWVHYELRAVMDDGEIWADGPDNFDYSAITFFGHIGYASLSMESRRWETRRFTATFAPPRPGASLDTAGTDRTLIQELLRGPIGFTITAGRGAGRRGRLELVATHFRSNP